MTPMVREILDDLELPAGEREALVRACELAVDGPGSRHAMGYLVVEHVATLPDIDPALVAEARRRIEVAGGRFGEVTFDQVAAMMSWLVVRLGLAQEAGPSLAERTNHLLAQAMTAQRETPLMQTLVRACDGQWEVFIHDYDTLRRVFSSGEGRNTSYPAPGTCVITIEGRHVPAMAYIARGTFEGLLGVFQQRGSVDLETSGQRLSVTVRW